MNAPRAMLALALTLGPLGAWAQNTPPGYTFGGLFGNNGFGNHGTYGLPGLYGFPGSYGLPLYGVPGAGFGQSPFLTMPYAQYPYANPQFPPVDQPRGQTQQQPPVQATPGPSPYPANPMPAPTPYWMQTPTSPQPPERYITEVPGQGSGENAPGSADQSPPTPPRWAPLPGQSAPSSPASPQQGQGNLWAAPQAATPPKWPTP